LSIILTAYFNLATFFYNKHYVFVSG